MKMPNNQNQPSTLNKKALKKNLNNIKSTNYHVVQLIDHLKSNHTFTTEEEEQLKKVQDHMWNMNEMFVQIEKGM